MRKEKNEGKYGQYINKREQERGQVAEVGNGMKKRHGWKVKGKLKLNEYENAK